MRKSPITSPEAAVRVVQGATASIAPPKHIPLADAALWHFTAIIEQKAKAEWTAHEIDLAAMLARTMARHIAELEKLEAEGHVIEGSGGPKVNPRARVVKMLAEQTLSYRRSLSLHGRAIHGEARDAARRNRIGREIEADADDLLARPH